MEKIKDLRDILKKAITECCANADCDTMEKIFSCADWTWTDHITEECYCPTARELRKCMYEIGIDALESLMKYYDREDWSNVHRPHTFESGRLFFTIGWNIEGEDIDILRDVELSCGISNEFATTAIESYTDNSYITDTFADDNEYRGEFSRNK